VSGYDPETYMPSVKPREIELLREALKECSDELAEWVTNHYASSTMYPTQQRRYDRDMEPVLRARALLAMPAEDDLGPMRRKRDGTLS
jgi:hypothetical protein